eukprot:4422675-Amphidinium_carterae.2
MMWPGPNRTGKTASLPGLGTPVERAPMPEVRALGGSSRAKGTSGRYSTSKACSHCGGVQLVACERCGGGWCQTSGKSGMSTKAFVAIRLP